MKKLLSFFLCLAAITVSPAAGKAPKPPKGVFTVETYAEAKSQAIAEKKLLVYMWSELESTCPLCSAGTDAAMKAFKSNKDAVLVFGEGAETNHAPAGLRGSLHEAAKRGNAIPVVIIVDPNTEKMLAYGCYTQFAQDERVWKKMLKEAQASMSKPAAGKAS